MTTFRKKDMKFSFESGEPSSELYSIIKESINKDKNKCENWKVGNQIVKIYTPVLVYLFKSRNLNVNDFSKRIDSSQLYPVYEQKAINGREYFKAYEEGYKQGVKYFDTTFNPAHLYSPNAKTMIRDMKFNYFGDEKSSPPKTGYKYVKTVIPHILSGEIIKKIGYDSGIVSRTEEIAEKHPELFKGFYENKTIELKETIRKSKLDFTVSKLESLVLEVAQISGNDNPVYYLDEFLNDVKGFDDLEFQQTFIQNLYSLIKANSAKFWNNDHKKKIKEWLLKNTGNMIIPSLEELWKISDNEAEGEKEYTDKNDLIKSTIVAYLKPFEERLTESHYYYLIEYLLEYFKTNHFPNITGTIDFKRVNKKKVGWALNQIF
ncbi:MAG: hypothetical protein ACK5RG_05765, partial [Cyclobacteriaceae bacterium]